MSTETPVALITGAASGLGWGMAQHYHQQGYDLLLVDRDRPMLDNKKQALDGQQTTSQQRVVTLCIDLLSIDAVGAVVDQLQQSFGRLSLLINNAGITHRSPADATDFSVTEKVMSLDFMVPVALTQRCLPLLQTQCDQHRPATIINLGSMAGWMPVMGRSSYCAAKGALHQYFETLRAEISHSGIHILMVYPSFLATDIEKNALSGNGQAAAHARSTVGKIHSVDWMIAKIASAHTRKQDRLFPNRIISLASLFYRLMPSLFLRMMRRRFSVELASEQAS